MERGETENIKYVNEASEILIDLSQKEKTTMEKPVSNGTLLLMRNIIIPT